LPLDPGSEPPLNDALDKGTLSNRVNAARVSEGCTVKKEPGAKALWSSKKKKTVTLQRRNCEFAPGTRA